MFVTHLTKPDGRRLALYGVEPITHGDLYALDTAVTPANPHLRWHPLRGEWVDYASHRQNRTFMPAAEANPLAPSGDSAHPTELPTGNYDIAVFDNRFPSLSATAHDPAPGIIATLPARGRCEVIVFSQNPQATLSGMALSQIELLLEVWGERTRELGADPEIQFVLPFENRGVEVGVTLHHPHGQIYAYPFVPPVPQRMQSEAAAHYARTGTPLLPELIAAEIADGERLLYCGAHAVAFVPAWARYPYEVWVAPIAPVADFTAFDAAQRADLARALKTTLQKYDGLWQRPLPYLMAWFQAPTDGQPHPETQLHAEFYPPYRSRDRLKYLAGTEIAAGMFANDVLPEASARELQAIAVDLDD